MQNALNLTDHIKLFILLIFISCIWSCNDVQELEEPDNLISKEKMIDIYTDMILLDAIQRSNPRNFKTYELKSSEHIFNKFGIDSTTLAQNIKFYNLDFESNSDIYEKVKLNIEKKNEIIDSTTKVRDSLKEVEKKKKIEKDSIKPKKKVKKNNLKKDD